MSTVLGIAFGLFLGAAIISALHAYVGGHERKVGRAAVSVAFTLLATLVAGLVGLQTLAEMTP